MTHHRIVIGQGTLVHADGQRRGRGGPRGAAVGANHSAGGVVVRGGTTPAASPAPAATRTAPALVQGRNTFRAIQEDGLGLWVIASKCRDRVDGSPRVRMVGVSWKICPCNLPLTTRLCD